jgi:hypothetical protein
MHPCSSIFTIRREMQPGGFSSQFWLPSSLEVLVFSGRVLLHLPDFSCMKLYDKRFALVSSIPQDKK